jgi:hypothetical protein
MAETYFQGNHEHPQHISVGGILVNESGEICVHHFIKNTAGYFAENDLKNFYILMRETLKSNETLEAALARGLKEEFGAVGTLVDYVGSLRVHWNHKGIPVEKTTLYFLARLVSQDESLRKKSGEGTSILEWHTPDFVISAIKEQGKLLKREDLDESSIVERNKRYLS